MPTLLLADDSIPIQRLVRSSLEGLDIEIRCVGDDAEAFSALEGSEPDLVLVDRNLPSGGAEGVVGWMAKRRMTAPVVVLMSPLDDFDVSRARRMGAAGVFIKPFEPTALQELIGRHLPDVWSPPAEGDADAPFGRGKDSSRLALDRIRREVLEVGAELIVRTSDGRQARIPEEEARTIFKDAVDALLGGATLDVRVDRLLRDVVREEMLRILPVIVREEVRARIAEIERDATRRAQESEG